MGWISDVGFKKWSFFFFLNLELKKFNEELGTSYYLERLLFR